MKLKTLFAALFIFTFLFTACDKKKEDPTPTPEPTTQPTGPGMFAKINNSDWTAAIPMAMLQNGDLALGGSSLNGLLIGVNVQGSNISQPGTYSGTGALTESSQDTTMGPTWVGPTATLVVSKLDPTGKKISGTFSFIAYPVPGTGASSIKTISGGIFNDIPLQ